MAENARFERYGDNTMAVVHERVAAHSTAQDRLGINIAGKSRIIGAQQVSTAKRRGVQAEIQGGGSSGGRRPTSDDDDG